MSNQRLARRIRAFHRLMSYRRGLLRLTAEHESPMMLTSAGGGA